MGIPLNARTVARDQGVMTGKSAKSEDNTASVAQKFGVSVKALRLYEQLGMLTPPRTKLGWRVYGRQEIERLHAIFSLKQLGLPLARIAEMLQAGVTDLNALLTVQEQMLLETRRETDHALTLIQIAKVRICDSGNLSVDELSALVHSISKTIIRSTPELEELARRIYTPEQMAKMYGRERRAEEVSRLSAFWAQINADIDAMLPNGDPLSNEGLAVARRLAAMFRETTRGDKELWNSAARFWQEVVSNPRIAEQLPMAKTHWIFISKAMGELHRRGELKP